MKQNQNRASAQALADVARNTSEQHTRAFRHLEKAIEAYAAKAGPLSTGGLLASRASQYLSQQGEKEDPSLQVEVNISTKVRTNGPAKTPTRKRK